VARQHVTGSETREANRNKDRDATLVKMMLLTNALADILMESGLTTREDIEARITSEVRNASAAKTGN